ncbi:MAG: hypothetical protein ABFS86_08280 [Planctomycetota bacterium]
MPGFKALHASAIILMLLLLAACASPEPTTAGNMDPDREHLGGGITSNDVRTMASRMAPKILALPEIAGSEDVTRIAIAPFRNSTRFVIDKEIFMKRLRVTLSEYGAGQVRFFSQGMAQTTRREILDDRLDEEIDESMAKMGADIAAQDFVSSAKEPVTMAVLPVRNTNVINQNADSFAALVRGKVVENADGQVRFTAPGADADVDYYLTGQFIAKSMKQEGIVNLLHYYDILEERMRNNEPLLTSGSVVAMPGGSVVTTSTDVNYAPPPNLRIDPRFQKNPNVDKYLNVMIIDPETKVIVYEKMMTIDRKVTEGLGKANYILSGEISGISKRLEGEQTDYILVTLQLVDPVSNEILWESDYESKRKSSAGIVYK